MIMAVGLSIAGAGTHLYQWLAKEQAVLRYNGSTLLRTFGLLFMSFICGPYIVLQMGWRQEADGTMTLSSALLAAFVAFGWSFITGLLIVGGYFSIVA
jgi:cytochrome c biogenesis protein CcdA